MLFMGKSTISTGPFSIAFCRFTMKILTFQKEGMNRCWRLLVENGRSATFLRHLSNGSPAEEKCPAMSVSQLPISSDN